MKARARLGVSISMVLAAPLPEQVVYNIYQQLLDMRARQPSFIVSTELISDSNPLLNAGSRSIEINGQPYQLNDQARAEAATGLACPCVCSESGRGAGSQAFRDRR